LEDLLVFKTMTGLYAPTIMPFGPMNCPAAMQRFMNHIFTPLYAKYNHRFKNYIDDCLIATGPERITCTMKSQSPSSPSSAITTCS
jgi:hypothetical protein